MPDAVIFCELWRGEVLESVHRGHAVICGPDGEIVAAWGDPHKIILPRSSAKMLQALPLIESGAAARHGLTDTHLALACASHNGAAMHTAPVAAWLAQIGLGEPDLRCGPQWPDRRDDLLALAGETPNQLHNNCSGKHAGFLTLARHLGAGPEYTEPDHPVQRACLEAFERMTGTTSPGYGIDGCSAPNFATPLAAMASAMARCATAKPDTALHDLVSAMAKHPHLVAGDGRACTNLMRAMEGRGVVKTGAEGVFVAILPQTGHGIALKIEDGATRASEAAIAALLVRLGALDPTHPAAQALMDAPILSRRGLDAGRMRAPDVLRISEP